MANQERHTTFDFSGRSISLFAVLLNSRCKPERCESQRNWSMSHHNDIIDSASPSSVVEEGLNVGLLLP